MEMDKDNPDPRKNHTPGHENHGVHACNKCGWPFPNPHPSAKHRRAHRKICGTIEGYKFVDSEGTALLPVSDDDLSDEDRQSPIKSPKIGLKNEEDSSGVGGRANRPEDETFADAATEFPDSGSVLSIKEHMGNANKPASNVEMVDTATQSDEKNAINFTIPPPSDPADSSSQVQNAEFPGSNLSESAQGPQHHVLSAANGLASTSLTDSRTEEFVYKLPNNEIGSACDSSPVKLETQTNASIENKKNYVGEDSIENEGKGISLDIQLENVISSPRDDTCKAIAVISELGKAKDMALNPAPTTGVVQIEGELNDELGSKLSSDDLPCEAKPVEHMNSTIDTDYIVVDHASVLDPTKPGGSVGGNDGKEDADVLVFSVPGAVPAVGSDEAMIIGFKDHRGGKLPHFVGVESFEVINDAKRLIPDDNPSGFISSQLNEGTEVWASDMRVLKDNIEPKGGSSELVEQLPLEGEANVPRINITVNENQRSEELRTITDSGKFESERRNTVQSLEEHVAPDFSQTNSLGHATKVVSDANPLVSPIDAGVSWATNLLCNNDIVNYEKANIERCDVIGNDNNEKITEDSCPENIIAMPKPNANARTDLIQEDNAADYDKDKIERYKAAGIEIGEDDSASGSVEDNLSGKSRTLPESASDHLVSEDAINASELKLPELESRNLGGVSDTQDCVKEFGTCSDNKIQTDCIGGVSIATESANGLEVEVLPKSADEQVVKESLTSVLDASSYTGNPATVDDGHARDFTGVVCGNRSESLTNEGDRNVVAQQFGASATDFSVDSSSQTDSLEGHWGSVSVLSTQSDIPAIVDTELFPSLGSQASAETEKASLKKPKAVIETQHSDKSDIFEPPSFMTLVEPAGGSDQNAVSSEILTQKGQQQPKGASLQAGWFPSITHVVNESQGRKKNEEIIAKVTNWSAEKQHNVQGQPHIPLNSRLGEANIETKSRSPNAKEDPFLASRPFWEKQPTASAILGPQAPVTEPTKKEEGNSPARYPAGVKTEKREVKKPCWARFMCCSSVN